MVLKLLYFQKMTKNRPGAGLRPQILVSDTFDLQCTSLLKQVSQFRHFHISNIVLSPPLLNECLVTCQNQATAFDLPFYDIFAFQKIPFSKFLMTSLHVICGLPPPQTKILAAPMVPGHLVVNIVVNYCCR